MKRTCMMILAVVMLAIGSAGAYNPYAPNPFDTMDRNSWEFQYLQDLSKAGLTGSDMSKFSPIYSLTRYEMVQMVDAAIKNQSRATEEQQAKINRLAAEFADELEFANGTNEEVTTEGNVFNWKGE